MSVLVKLMDEASGNRQKIYHNLNTEDLVVQLRNSANTTPPFADVFVNNPDYVEVSVDGTYDDGPLKVVIAY